MTDVRMEVVVAERGQITLPKPVRDALGLTKGMTLKVEVQGGRIILRKDVSEVIARVRGRFKAAASGASADTALHELRGHPAPSVLSDPASRGDGVSA